MTRRAGASYALLTLSLAVSCVGCSAVLSATGPRWRDLDVLEPGTPRPAVVHALGLPQESSGDDGGRLDAWYFTQGDPVWRKLGKIVLYVGVDFFTLGLWEPFGIAIEIHRQEQRTYLVAYGPDGKVRLSTILGPRGFIRQEGLLQPGGVTTPDAASADSRLETAFDRTTDLGHIAENHGLTVDVLAFTPRGRGKVHIENPDADTASRVEPYVAELCTSEHGLLSRWPSTAPAPRHQVDRVLTADGSMSVDFRCEGVQRSNRLQIGIARRVLIGDLGLPDESGRTDEGSRVEAWRFESVMNRLFGGEALTCVVGYDATGRVTSLATFGRARGAVEQRGMTRPIPRMVLAAAATGSALTPQLARYDALAQAAHGHGLHVTELVFSPSDGGRLTLAPVGANDDQQMDGYLSALCASASVGSKEAASTATKRPDVTHTSLGESGQLVTFECR